MSIRTILVPADGTDSCSRLLHAAFTLAAELQAHVFALHVRVLPADAVPFVGEGMSGVLVQELIELTERQSAARARAAQALFEEARQQAGLPSHVTPGAAGASAEWVETPGREEDVIVRYGRVSDLLVVARPSGEPGSWTEAAFGMALFGTGRPVLVVGPEAGFAMPRSVTIAWNTSTEAARAVAAALPFLQRAERVRAISAVSGGEDEAVLGDLISYLAWHGIAAERQAIDGRGAVAEALADAARGSDLLVMGGYSHSRLRELIVGGVTRHMLEHATLPLLLAH